jgi:hypothetical protein
MRESMHQNMLLHEEVRGMLSEPGQFEQFREVMMTSGMPDPLPYTHGIELRVAPELRAGSGQCRGRALLFVSAGGLQEEVDRWASILNQFGFRFDSYRDATYRTIRDVLVGVAHQPFDGNTLFVMIIGSTYFGDTNDRPDNELSVKEIMDTF